MQRKIRSSSKRQIELDILRILAMFAVVIVHACGMNTQDVPSYDINRGIATLIPALLTWEIPAFVMISGRFFLDPEREVTINRVVKAIIRLCIAFGVWDLIYQFHYILMGTYDNLNWKGIIVQTIQGPYHFWYMYMMVGLYLLIPFLRKITENKTLMEYFLLLFVIFSFLTNYGSLLPVVGETIDTILGHIQFHFALGFSGYFVAGYYLHKYPLKKKQEMLIYIFGIALWLGAAILTVLNSVYNNVHDEMFVKYLTPNVAIESFAIYTFFIKRVSRWNLKSRLSFAIERISEYSAGIYYIHALILEFFGIAGLSPFEALPLIMVPLVALIAIIMSGFAVCIIRKIPRIGTKIT